MLSMALTSLANAQLSALTPQGRFTSTYNAAHAAALATLRWRVLDAAHQKRNMAEYEGFLEVDESHIAELCALVTDLTADAASLLGEGT
jgi:hypothetical protein